MVEKNFKNYKLILENVKKLEVQDVAKVYKSTVRDFLNHINKKYELILVDPPFELNEWESILMNIGQRGILNSGGVLVAEHSSSLSLEKSMVN